jgi:hypothetical protein
VVAISAGGVGAPVHPVREKSPDPNGMNLVVKLELIVGKQCCRSTAINLTERKPPARM